MGRNAEEIDNVPAPFGSRLGAHRVEPLLPPWRRGSAFLSGPGLRLGRVTMATRG